MAVYTDITDEELDALLADYDVGSAVAFKGIAEGVENSNFLLETERGRFILTLYERRVKADELPYFLDLLTWLADHGFPSARPVADRQGRVLKAVRGKPAAMVEFLTGLSVRRPTVAHCRQAGEGLARLHLAGAGYPARRVNDLGQAAWAPLFAGVYAQDAFEPPLASKAAVIGRAMATHGIERGRAMYVGDRAEDGEAATTNGLRFAWAVWGYGTDLDLSGFIRPITLERPEMLEAIRI
jgi:homoserine kinase type II